MKIVKESVIEVTGKVTNTEPEPEPVATGSANVFDNLSSLRLSQDFHKEVGMRKVLTRVPVRKPNKQEFFRVHPEPEYRLETALLELKEEREFYLLAPNVRDQMPGDWIGVRLMTCTNRQNIPFLWPAKLPDPDGRANSWYETALAAAALAMDRWTKMVPDMHLGGYQTYLATGKLSEPEWPEHSFRKLMEVAFKDTFIDDMDHPVIARLLGYE